MTSLAPFATLYQAQAESDVDLPLPAALQDLYGSLQFPSQNGRPYVIANFVSSLDGVVSLGIPGRSGGGEISGSNEHDRALMGILRATADAVVVGAGTQRSVSPDHIWDAAYIFPALADAYQRLRTDMGKTQPPLNVIVSSSGKLDLSRRLFQSAGVPVLIVTTAQGQENLGPQLPPSVRVAVVQPLADGQISARVVLDACRSHLERSELILLEGGPHLMGNFLAEKCLDEVFLTVAPQIVGRTDSAQRPAFVSGKLFAPDHPLWGTLASVRAAGSHLFLRYVFETH